MPRLKVSDTEARRRRMQAVIRGYMIVKGYDGGDMARIMGISRSGFYQKLRNPGEFRMQELQQLHLTQDEKLGVFG